MNLGEFLPQRPAAAVGLGQGFGARVIEPRLEASVIEAFWRNTKSSAPTATVSVAPPQRTVKAVAANLPSTPQDGEIRHAAAVADLDALLLEPALQRADQRIVLVEDRSLDAGERFDAA